MKFEDLSPELQEKAMACETAEDVFELAKAEGIELSEEDLELVSGGFKGWKEPLKRRESTDAGDQAIFV